MVALISYFLTRMNVVLLYALNYHDIHHVINVSRSYKTEGGMEDRLGKRYLQKMKEYGFIDVKAITCNLTYNLLKLSYQM